MHILQSPKGNALLGKVRVIHYLSVLSASSSPMRPLFVSRSALVVYV